jgi:DNA-binding CsgD family transcriptional regulator
MAELSVGNAAEVEAALHGLAEAVQDMGGGDPVLCVFVPDQIEALVDLGELERAQSLLAWFESRAVELDRAWARAMAGRCRGLLDAAGGHHREALAALDEALLQNERADIPFERARTLLVLGRILRRNGQRARAAVALEDAREIFEKLGAHRWYESADAELRRTGRRAEFPDSLTGTERRVAELAASGISNREIAERAFLTTKAVEANLTRVYRKLGIKSRGGLARALDSVGSSFDK